MRWLLYILVVIPLLVGWTCPDGFVKDTENGVRGCRNPVMDHSLDMTGKTVDNGNPMEVSDVQDTMFGRKIGWSIGATRCPEEYFGNDYPVYWHGGFFYCRPYEPEGLRII